MTIGIIILVIVLITFAAAIGKVIGVILDASASVVSAILIKAYCINYLASTAGIFSAKIADKIASVFDSEFGFKIFVILAIVIFLLIRLIKFRIKALFKIIK